MDLKKLEQKYKRRDKKHQKKMTVSGKSVFKLAQIIRKKKK